MSDIFSKASKILLLWLPITIGFFCCAKSTFNDPATDDLSDLTIDPDQPALPADSSGDIPGGSTPSRQNDSVSAEKAEKDDKVIETVMPTPKVQNLEGDRQFENAPVEQEPPASQGATESEQALSRFGSGPQIRYIKAAELNVREKPDRYSKIVGVLKGGDKVLVKVSGGWAKLDEGRWIRSRWLVKQKPSGGFAQDGDRAESQPLKQKSGKKRELKSTRKKKSKQS